MEWQVLTFRLQKCRHEMPTDKDDPMAKQNIKDRYHGTNDPVARKMLGQYAASKGLVPPDDQSVVRDIPNPWLDLNSLLYTYPIV